MHDGLKLLRSQLSVASLDVRLTERTTTVNQLKVRLHGQFCLADSVTAVNLLKLSLFFTFFMKLYNSSYYITSVTT